MKIDHGKWVYNFIFILAYTVTKDKSSPGAWDKHDLKHMKDEFNSSKQDSQTIHFNYTCYFCRFNTVSIYMATKSYSVVEIYTAWNLFNVCIKYDSKF